MKQENSYLDHMSGSPFFALVMLILNDAIDRGACRIRLCPKDKRLCCECKLGNEWQPMESPPLYLWKNIANMLVLAAGFETWDKGLKKGVVSHKYFDDDSEDQWELICEDHYKEIILQRIEV